MEETKKHDFYVHSILNSAYIIPVLLEYLDKPTRRLELALESVGIDKEIIAEIRELKPMLEYHLEMVQNNYQANYLLLRQGLKAYFDKYLSMIWIKLGLVGTNKTLLDYGCGNGYYSDLFKQQNPAGSAVQLDRNPPSQPCIAVDFEKLPGWWVPYQRSFDIVLISELLHCKDAAGQKYIIESAQHVLKPGGKIVIVENDDYFMEHRLQKIKGNDSVGVVHDATIEDLFYFAARSGPRLTRTNYLKIQKHHVYVYEKV